MDRGRKPLEAILGAVLCEEANSPRPKEDRGLNVGGRSAAVRAPVPYAQRTLRSTPLCSSPLPARVPLIVKAEDPNELPPARRAELLYGVGGVVIGVVSGKCELVLLRLRVIVSAPSTTALAARWNSATPP